MGDGGKFNQVSVKELWDTGTDNPEVDISTQYSEWQMGVPKPVGVLRRGLC